MDNSLMPSVFDKINNKPYLNKIKYCLKIIKKNMFQIIPFLKV